MNFRSYDRTSALTLALTAVCFHLIFSPVWAPGIVPRLYDGARYLELGLFAFLALLLMSPKVADAVTSVWLSLGRMPGILITLLLGFGALSAMASAAAHLGSIEVALVAQLFLLFLIVASAVRDDRVQTEAVLAVALSAGAALCVFKFWVTYALFTFEGKVFPWISPFLDFANVRFFSQYQAYVLALVMLPTLMLRTGRGVRILLYLVAANFWALQWMVGTRAVWLGFGVAVLVVLAFMRQGRLPWLRQQAIVVLGGAAIHLVFSHAVASLPDVAPVPGVTSIVERDQGSINERIALAKSALQFVRERPLLGVGPGQFGLQNYPMNAAHPHNVPLQLLSEYGVIAGTAGVVIGAMLVLFAVRTLRPASSGRPDPVGASLVAALITGLTDSLFTGNLIMPHSQVLFCVVAGWIIGRSLPDRSDVAADRTAFRTLKFAIVSTAILAAATTTILALEYLPVVRELPAWMPRWNPHFWQYGRFNAW